MTNVRWFGLMTWAIFFDLAGDLTGLSALRISLGRVGGVR
jgi:hypothetical protein